MVRLEMPETGIEIKQAGVVSFMAVNDVKAPWIALSGGWLSVLANPVLFGIFGYTHGQRTIDGRVEFRLPNYNEGEGVNATFVRAWNSKNSSGRNTSKAIGTHHAAQLKSHTHYGSTDSDGNHSHSSVSGSKLTASAGPVFTSSAGGQNSVRYGPTTGTAGHSSHSHSAGSTSGTTIPVVNDNGIVEPKGYGAILCIHLG